MFEHQAPLLLPSHGARDFYSKNLRIQLPFSQLYNDALGQLLPDKYKLTHWCSFEILAPSQQVSQTNRIAFAHSSTTTPGNNVVSCVFVF